MLLLAPSSIVQLKCVIYLSVDGFCYVWSRVVLYETTKFYSYASSMKLIWLISHACIVILALTQLNS